MEARDKKILVQSVCAVLLIVVLFNVYSGVTVSKIGIPGLIDLEFNSGSSPDSKPGTDSNNRNDFETYDEFESGNSADESFQVRGTDTQNPAVRNPEMVTPGVINRPVQQPETVPAVLDLNGRWYGEDGSEYDISQVGSSVSFTEYGMFGATASGYGNYQNNRLSLEYETVFGTYGTAILNLSHDGRMMSGRADDLTSGASTTLVLRRY